MSIPPPVAAPSGWSIEKIRGTAEEHHLRDIDSWSRAAMLLEHADGAIVIGSTQSESDVDPRAAHDLGLSLVRRRSGGGAVYLDPQSAVWVDVVIPRDDALWTDDVSVSALWLGRVWVGALSELGLNELVVHDGPMVKSPLSRTICFDGLAPGEVTSRGCKAVGISQRRTRDGARFQCVVYRQWTPARWRDCLASPDARDGLDRLCVETVGASGDEVLVALSRALAAVSTP